VTTFPFGLPSRYEFAGERLEGGHGYVYICHDKYLDRKVAIKVMRNISDAHMLTRELAVMRDVRSQHVAEIYDLLFAKRSAMAGLVQEYVSGESLEAYALRRNDREDVLKSIWQLARGIADIHAHGKLHRDIKPSNARFDSENVLKILDFGITSDLTSTSNTSRARGTRDFLGPEFYDTPPIKLTEAADVYAFGVTVWFIASKAKLPGPLQETPPQRSSPVQSLVVAWPDWNNDLIRILDSTLHVRPTSDHECTWSKSYSNDISSLADTAQFFATKDERKS
jgi:eukaryotic-like serine/threonine-protein kinase